MNNSLYDRSSCCKKRSSCSFDCDCCNNTKNSNRCCSDNDDNSLLDILSNSNCGCSTSITSSSTALCPSNNNNLVTASLNNLDDNLCDIKVTLAEAKATLLFLAQTLCSNGNLTDTERSLLLNLEQSLKKINCSVNDSISDVNCLNSIL
ncbi:hypothetical protein KQI77_08975 [Clostridium sp. MSJ-8]|uniref:hypothetical protein n=1 Tax=Clostridium sp. MSJ-8 TaxID=2841510 RepID=UPI001C0F11E8|nr:hypothetical protein [Clostridium sp. MSJ-8]MBU5488266.1 hypothetical protein [Clostridium sp. MSJ-8]